MLGVAVAHLVTVGLLGLGIGFGHRLGPGLSIHLERRSVSFELADDLPDLLVRSRRKPDLELVEHRRAQFGPEPDQVQADAFRPVTRIAAQAAQDSCGEPVDQGGRVELLGAPLLGGDRRVPEPGRRWGALVDVPILAVRPRVSMPSCRDAPRPLLSARAVPAAG